MRQRGAAIRGFDGLRALAALTVLSYHVALSRSFAPAGRFAPLLWELKGGVAIFFVISGALLWLPYARALRDRRAVPGWRAYAARRAVRILPAYWLALTVLALAGRLPSAHLADAWRYYTLSQIYEPRTLFGGVGVAWSLCVEVSFYALLPLLGWLLALLARRAGGRSIVRLELAAIAAAGVASLVLRGAVAGSLSAGVPHGAKPLMVTLPGLLDWFAIGMALAVLRSELEAGRGTRCAPAALGRRTGWCVLLAAAAFIAALPTQQGDQFLPWYGLETHVAMGAGAGLLVLAVIVPPSGERAGWTLRVLSHPVVVWLGTVSYGIYLWHGAVLALVQAHIPSGPAGTGLEWLAVAAGATGLAAVSWHFVERPLQRRLVIRGRRTGRDGPGRVIELDIGVQSTFDPLNPNGVAVDHLA